MLTPSSFTGRISRPSRASRLQGIWRRSAESRRFTGKATGSWNCARCSCCYVPPRQSRSPLPGRAALTSFARPGVVPPPAERAQEDLAGSAVVAIRRGILPGQPSAMKTTQKIAAARAIYQIVHAGRALMGRTDRQVVTRNGIAYDLDLSQ